MIEQEIEARKIYIEYLEDLIRIEKESINDWLLFTRIIGIAMAILLWFIMIERVI